MEKYVYIIYMQVIGSKNTAKVVITNDERWFFDFGLVVTLLLTKAKANIGVTTVS